MLEQQHDEERERERRKQKRVQRKNREAFIVLLDELHEQKMLTSTSLWKDLYSVISKDDRFYKMLAQRGSTPLDLFKFYVEALKARYPAERKIVKEIVKDHGYVVDVSTNFVDFAAFIEKDERSAGIDDGNLRMAFDSLLEKAHGRERERQRDDARRLRKMEQSFRDMLSSANFTDSDVTWEEVRNRFASHPAFIALSLESERIRIFKEFIISLQSAEDAEGGKSRRARGEKSRNKAELTDRSERHEKHRKRPASTSPDPSEASATNQSDIETGTASGKRKHRKSKKSKKKKKTKHHKHRKSSGRQGGEEELEEGEAADDDDEDEDDTGSVDHTSRRHRRKRNHHRSNSSDPEDGEEVDSGSEGEVYEHEGKRKRHR
ncbi:unnamed protein product [Dicrocoelium dendriticum]|nr:unnamed protein product [Dicrocoelium dendriticum]